MCYIALLFSWENILCQNMGVTLKTSSRSYLTQLKQSHDETWKDFLWKLPNMCILIIHLSLFLCWHDTNSIKTTDTLLIKYILVIKQMINRQALLLFISLLYLGKRKRDGCIMCLYILFVAWQKETFFILKFTTHFLSFTMAS